MGLSISYPPDDYLPEDDDDDMDRLFVRSLSFDNLSTLDTLESPPALLDALTSKRLIIRGSLSFETRDSDPFQAETTLSMVSPKPAKKRGNYKPINLRRHGSLDNLSPNSPVIAMVSLKHQAAAIRVQKVYRSFRTRRQLADCAVLVEQRWFVRFYAFNHSFSYLIWCFSDIGAMITNFFEFWCWNQVETTWFRTAQAQFSVILWGTEAGDGPLKVVSCQNESCQGKFTCLQIMLHNHYFELVTVNCKKKMYYGTLSSWHYFDPFVSINHFL